MESNLEKPGKDIGLIAYLTLIGLIVAMVMNNDKKTEFGRYHIRQSLGVFLTGFSLFIISFIPYIGWVISFLGFFFVIFLLIMGILNAVNGRMEPVPLLGERYNEWLKNM